MKGELAGGWSTTATGRPSFEVFAASPEMVFAVLKLSARVGFTVVRGPGVGLDCVIAEIERERVRICVGWDIWSGVYVFASDERGDDAVRELAKLVEPRLITAEFQRYVQVW